ncbi:MAG TPA: FosX/FosE/FosI family fosfomycin resistance hydrolase [Methyloradius sp.]
MQIEAISHITFIVHDLERMTQFLCEGLGAREAYDSRDKNFSLSREKFFILGSTWLVAMEGNPPAERTYRHLAFKVAPEALPYFEQRLRLIGVEFKAARPRVEGEGNSLYFYDFDNHLFELHTGTLEERLQTYQNNS